MNVSFAGRVPPTSHDPSLINGTDPVAVRAEGAVSGDAPAGVVMETVEPLVRRPGAD